MARILNNIDKNHILKAIERFEKKNLLNPNDNSQHYDFLYKCKRYPPKVIISFVNKSYNDREKLFKSFDKYHLFGVNKISCINTI